MNLKQEIIRTVQREAPTMMTFGGIVGFIAASVLAAKATPTAIDVLDATKFEHEEDTPKRRIEEAKALAPVYAPTVGMLLLSAGLVSGGLYVTNTRMGALTGLYLATRKSLTKLEDSVAKNLSPKKLEEVYSDADEPPEDMAIPTSQKPGHTVLVYDRYSDRLLYVPSVEWVREGVNNINRQMLVDGYASLNDLYLELGLPPVGYGDELGWSIEHELIDYRLGSRLIRDNIPCVTLAFLANPKHSYSRFGGV